MRVRGRRALFLLPISVAAVGLALIMSIGASGANGATITALQEVLPSPVAVGGDFTGHTGFEGYPGIYVQPEFSAAEVFQGQTVVLDGLFESVSGVPTGPLQVPIPPNGITLFWDGLEGQTGPCGADCTGEGAVSLAFTSPQPAVGFDIGWWHGGAVTFQFFEPDGTPFETFTLWGTNSSWTFQAEEGHRIGGVTITNTDETGIEIDNLRLLETPTAADASTWGALKSLYLR